MASTWRWLEVLFLGCLLGLTCEAVSHLIGRRQLHKDLTLLVDLDLKCGQVQIGMGHAAAGPQVVDALVDGVGQCDEPLGLHADQSTRDSPDLLMGTKILHAKPPPVFLCLAWQVEYSDLLLAMFHSHAAIVREVLDLARQDPRPTFRCCLLAVEHWALDIRQIVRVRMPLLAHVDVFDLLGLLRLRGVDVLLELFLQALVVHDLLPLALVVADVAGHHRLKVCTETQRVIDDNLAQVLDATRKLLKPRRGPLQVLRGGDIEHQETI
mmetsp:Transcript_102920/g.268156  ORF Transcript_102920/g.268156 Transcript_102920/m.268156 type:complete len:267 (+) Transcript_102920:530-1330(+)